MKITSLFNHKKRHPVIQNAFNVLFNDYFISSHRPMHGTDLLPTAVFVVDR